MSDDGGCEKEVEVRASTSQEAIDKVPRHAKAWCENGSWGADGAQVTVYWTVTCADGVKIANGWLDVVV